MTVYIEPVTSNEAGRFSRLRADDLTELREFAETAGIAGEFVPHVTVADMGYVRCDRKDRRRALRYGAQEVSWHDAYGRLGRLVVDGTRRPAAPDFTKFGMIRRQGGVVPTVAQSAPPIVTTTTLTKSAFRSQNIGRRPTQPSQVCIVEVAPC